MRHARIIPQPGASREEMLMTAPHRSDDSVYARVDHLETRTQQSSDAAFGTALGKQLRTGDDPVLRFRNLEHWPFTFAMRRWMANE
jgi:hypothetical protein